MSESENKSDITQPAPAEQVEEFHSAVISGLVWRMRYRWRDDTGEWYVYELAIDKPDYTPAASKAA